MRAAFVGAPCGHIAPRLVSNHPRRVCTRPQGHEGDHVEAKAGSGLFVQSVKRKYFGTRVRLLPTGSKAPMIRARWSS